LKVDELVFDTSLYPRMKTSWLTAYQYAQSMRAGAVFPPITVGVFEGKHYVVDGWHRVEAKKLLGEEYIDAEVKNFKSYAEMFIEAVKLNIAHGKPLSVHEKVRVIHRLEEFGVSREEISQITRVPIDKITLFKTRIVIGANGQPTYLKGITKRAAEKSGGSVELVDQSRFMGRDVNSLLTQLIEMIEGGIYPFEDEKTMELTVKLYRLIQEKLHLA